MSYTIEIAMWNKFFTLLIFPGTKKDWQAAGFEAIWSTRPYSPKPFLTCCSIGITLVVECSTIALKKSIGKTKIESGLKNFNENY